MKDGTITAFSSELTLGQFLRYPFRYLIHFTTKSKVEHVGIVCNDDHYEALASSGVIKEKLLIRLRHLGAYTKVSYYGLNKDLTAAQRISLLRDLEGQLGKKYSFIQAALSALDNFLPDFLRMGRVRKSKSKKHFCSKLDAYAYKNLGLINVTPRILSPEDLIQHLLEKNLVTKIK